MLVMRNEYPENDKNLTLASALTTRVNVLATGYDTFQSQIELAGQIFTIDPVIRQNIFNMFNEFNIIVCGFVHGGKSTLINAICAKTTSFVVSDLSKITLEHEFEFRPLQKRQIYVNGEMELKKDSIYAEMISSTMYSLSDYPLIDDFTNANSQLDDEQIKMNNILNNTITKMIDL
ncbi:unnamed protein product, partial [Rotaria sp. Silwood2]